MQKDRILMIAATPFYLEKGSSLRTYSILKILKAEYKVDLATYSLGTDIRIRNVEIHRTNRKYKPLLKVSEPTFAKLFLDFLLLILCMKLVLKNKCKIIHCEDFEAAVIGFIISFFSKDSKLVYDLHNRVIENLLRINKKRYLKKILLFCEKIVFKRINLVICNWKKYSEDPFLKNKANFQYYDKIELKVQKFSNDFRPYIIYSGNFEPYQGVEKFLEGFAGIENDISLVLVGELNKNILASISRLKLKDKVVTTGKMSITKTNYLIKNSLFAILPRISGEMPSMKVIHYLIWGKPVLANDVACNKELIIDSYNSLFYKGKNDLKTKLELLIDDHNLLSKLSEGALNTKNQILENWNEINFIKNYEETLGLNRFFQEK